MTQPDVNDLDTAIERIRAAMRERCRQSALDRLTVVGLVLALRARWQTLAPPPQWTTRDWDSLYQKLLGECLTEHFKVEAGRSTARGLMDKSSALRARADALISRAAQALARANEQTEQQGHLRGELALQRNALRAMMTELGGQLRHEGLDRPSARTLIETAAHRASDDVEEVMISWDAVTWAMEGYDAAA